jgi:HD superfamily phosphohydrolase YqeK
MERDLTGLLDWFSGYAEGYLRDGVGRGVLELKRDHCLRVLEECRRLTHEEGFEPALASACHAGALLHDVGRFPQYQKYGTLRDALSVNHAVLSAATIKREKVLAGYDRQAQRLILYAIVLHNRKNLPPSPNKALSLAAEVLRDADKLDIIRVMLGHFDMDAVDREAAFFGLDPDPKGYSPAILEAVWNRRMGGYAGMRYCNDFYLLVLSWAYDLNFKTSRRLFMQRGYARDIAASLSRVPGIEKLQRQVIQDLTE